MGFDSAFIFKYSERPNTRAAQKFPDDVTEADKKARIIELNKIQDEIGLKKNQALIGTTQHILTPHRKPDQQFCKTLLDFRA